MLSTSRHTEPRMFGNLAESIFPTSHIITFVTGSNEYLPWVVVNVTFSTDLGNGISRVMFSTYTTGRHRYTLNSVLIQLWCGHNIILVRSHKTWMVCTFCLKNMWLHVFNNNLNKGWQITVIFGCPPYPFYVTILPWEIVKPWKSRIAKLLIIHYMQNCNYDNLLTYYTTYSLRENNNKIYCTRNVCICIKKKFFKS